MLFVKLCICVVMYFCICVFVQCSFCTKAIFEIWFPLVLALGRPGRLELLSDWSYARSGRFIQHPLHGELPDNLVPDNLVPDNLVPDNSGVRLFRWQKIWCKKILVSDNSRAGHFWCQTIFLSGETQIRNWMIGVALHLIYIYPVCPVHGVAKNIPMSAVMSVCREQMIVNSARFTISRGSKNLARQYFFLAWGDLGIWRPCLARHLEPDFWVQILYIFDYDYMTGKKWSYY